jgi:guanosine-3',5'-bis(diphosphate) 3'-pyrophosphohydrolase
MIYSDQAHKALIIAYEAHKDQLDKVGVPYKYYPIHLAEQMASEEETVVALLHDVVEDTSWTFEELVQQGFSDEVIQTLKLLTHEKATEYMEYIWKIALSSYSFANKVKLADLKHNSALSRFSNIDDMNLNRIEKYHKAIEILEQNL